MCNGSSLKIPHAGKQYEIFFARPSKFMFFAKKCVLWINQFHFNARLSIDIIFDLLIRSIESTQPSCSSYQLLTFVLISFKTVLRSLLIQEHTHNRRRKLKVWLVSHLPYKNDWSTLSKGITSCIVEMSFALDTRQLKSLKRASIFAVD